MELNVDAGFRANLEAAKAEGLPVHVTLTNGARYEAWVGNMGEQFVVLTKLANKSFFDALIRLDAIASLEVRVRGG